MANINARYFQFQYEINTDLIIANLFFFDTLLTCAGKLICILGLGLNFHGLKVGLILLRNVVVYGPLEI